MENNAEQGYTEEKWQRSVGKHWWYKHSQTGTLDHTGLKGKTLALCSGHYILVSFSDSTHVTVCVL